MARAYLKPDRLSVVLVGNASTFVDQLAGVGFEKFEIIDLADLDLTRADLRRSGRPAASREPGSGQRPPAESAPAATAGPS